jgi:hypothetical protein
VVGGTCVGVDVGQANGRTSTTPAAWFGCARVVAKVIMNMITVKGGNLGVFRQVVLDSRSN